MCVYVYVCGAAYVCVGGGMGAYMGVSLYGCVYTCEAVCVV